MHPNVPYIIISHCLTPDDFTREVESTDNGLTQ